MRVFNESVEHLALAPVAVTADGTVDGLTIQRGAPSFRELTFVLIAGEITDGTHTLVIQESEDGSTWTDVPNSALAGSENSVELSENGVTSAYYAGSQSYVRMAIDSTGVTAGGLFAGIVILNKPRRTPAR